MAGEILRHKISTYLSLLLAVSPNDSSAFRRFLEISSEKSTINSIAAAMRQCSMRVNVCDEMALTKMFFRKREMLVIEHTIYIDESSTPVGNAMKLFAVSFSDCSNFSTRSFLRP